jgi:hypothetical protein
MSSQRKSYNIYCKRQLRNMERGTLVGLNPNVYATGATPEDPARRLSIKLTTENDQGRFQVWVTAGGDQTAKQINTLVEILEGVPDEEIAKRPRRFLGRDRLKGRPRTSYTT